MAVVVFYYFDALAVQDSYHLKMMPQFRGLNFCDLNEITVCLFSCSTGCFYNGIILWTSSCSRCLLKLSFEDLRVQPTVGDIGCCCLPGLSGSTMVSRCGLQDLRAGWVLREGAEGGEESENEYHIDSWVETWSDRFCLLCQFHYIFNSFVGTSSFIVLYVYM